MCSNSVSLINPYYTALGIASRMQGDTKFLKGEGFVLEHTFNENASNAQKEGAFNRAFKESRYLRYASENIYLNDNDTFIEKRKGMYRPVATIKWRGKYFSLKDYGDVYYCDKRVDGANTKIAMSVEDHEVGFTLIGNFRFMITMLREAFEKGMFRFYDLECKDCAMRLVSY